MGNAVQQIHALLADASQGFLQATSNLLRLDPAIVTENCARSTQEALK
ncbi:hypothetical protein PQR37_18560 [Paraburkholderia nemoris]